MFINVQNSSEVDINKERNNKDVITGRSEVMSFIDEFYNRRGANSDCDKKSLEKQFYNGYCFYFAHILKAAFNRGCVCCIVDGSHVIWLDDDNVGYDCQGVYNQYHGNRFNFWNKCLVHIDDMPQNYLTTYKHIPSQQLTSEGFDEFEEFCKTKGLELHNTLDDFICHKSTCNNTDNCSLTENEKIPDTDDMYLKRIYYGMDSIPYGIVHCLLRGGIYSLGDLLEKSPEEIMNIRGIGKVSYKKLFDALKGMGVDVSKYQSYDNI